MDASADRDVVPASLYIELLSTPQERTIATAAVAACVDHGLSYPASCEVARSVIRSGRRLGI
jgi:hypothetical protein